MLKCTLAAAVIGLVSFALVGCGKDNPPAPSNAAGGGGSSSTSASSGGGAVEDPIVGGKARDVVCGMVIDAKGSRDFVYRNTRFHFCSDDCLNKFKADPSKMTTGLPGETCICKTGGMANCKCGHCKGKEERCPCNDPEPKEEPSDGHEGHDHEHGK